MIGPIAFKAKEDGVTIATHPDGKVSNLMDPSIINSQFSMKKNRTITLKHGNKWNPSSQKEKSDPSVPPNFLPTLNLGVSNWNVSQLQQLLKTATITPAVNQIEIHPYSILRDGSLMS